MAVVLGNVYGLTAEFQENFRVLVRDAVSGDPISGVAISASNGTSTYEGVTGGDGYVDFLIDTGESLVFDLDYEPATTLYDSDTVEVTHPGTSNIYQHTIELRKMHSYKVRTKRGDEYSPFTSPVRTSIL